MPPQSVTTQIVNINFSVPEEPATLTLGSNVELKVLSSLCFHGHNGTVFEYPATNGRVICNNIANEWKAKQTFAACRFNAGLNVGWVEGDVDNPVEGDLWYNRTRRLYRGFNGVEVVTLAPVVEPKARLGLWDHLKAWWKQ